jgi:NAD(P)-dependent dehydrogenase (short-subunit alcohol dehydrogenase family)
MAALPRVALITGANRGIGLWVARGLIERGYRVLLLCRDADRGAAALAWLRQHCPCPVAPPQLYQADLAEQAEVRRVAARLCQEHAQLDLLVNNAGCLLRRRELTTAGVERMLAVNYLAPFLLTQELLPLLQAAPRARIVNIGSASADRARLSLAGLQQSPTMLQTYAQTKAALLIYTAEQARRLAKTPIVVNCAHPGVVATDIGQVGGSIGAFWWALRPFLLAPKRAAARLMPLLTAPAWGDASGCYVKRGKATRPHPQMADRALAHELWELSTSLTQRAGLP